MWEEGSQCIIHLLINAGYWNSGSSKWTQDQSPSIPPGWLIRLCDRRTSNTPITEALTYRQNRMLDTQFTDPASSENKHSSMLYALLSFIFCN